MRVPAASRALKQIATSEIHTFEMHAPRHCVNASAFESVHGCWNMYTQGLLTERYNACGEDEDTVSMALTAVHRMLRRCHVRPEDVGKLQISSVSLLDRSKSMKTELMTLLEQASGADAEAPTFME